MNKIKKFYKLTTSNSAAASPIDYFALCLLLCARLQISLCSSLSYATPELFSLSTTSCRWILYSSEASTILSFSMYHLHGVLATSHRLVIIIVNPYESASFVIGQTLAPFDDDNLILCFGFGSSTTHGEEVLSLQRDNSLSHGVEDVLSSYRRFTPTFLLSDALLEPYQMPVLEARRSIRADVRHQMSNPSLSMILSALGLSPHGFVSGCSTRAKPDARAGGQTLN
ncbi:hypothetical protein F2Q70_00002555 [Brassica cretica]|uniref:Copine C-terminal domain-containing protein n=1 Tax=Brassica cretica TaxID=69181 RepID=A0A8S9IR90_BRACR|nr:hypothetical protein F2Q70_00002555 [Brassica cretica]